MHKVFRFKLRLQGKANFVDLLNPFALENPEETLIRAPFCQVSKRKFSPEMSVM